MAPKKAAVVVNEAEPSEPSVTEQKEKKPDATTVRKLATHPSTAIMVREAIKALDSRKGVSSQAIQNYIKQKYPSVDLVRLKGLVRKALKKGLENGTLVRPANAATATQSATGRFRLSKTKETKAKSENVDPNVQKPPKADKEEPKKKKPAAKKKDEKQELSEEPVPAKKSKKDDASSSKVAPDKKPKATKKAAEPEDSETVKPKGKAKAVKGDKEKAEKAQKEKGKAAQSKSQAAKSDEAPAKTQGKRGKKATE